MNPLRIFAVCGDAGGAAAIAPVVRSLSERADVIVQSWAYGPGTDVLRKKNLNPRTLDGAVAFSALEALWRDFAPHLLLAGSSVNAYEYEKKFIQIARAKSIPSVVVMDSWSSYGTRFGPRLGVFDSLPEVIAVPDDRARREWIAAGVPEHQLVVTGHPAFDHLSAQKTAFTASHREELRRQYGVKPHEWFVGFFSQPIRQLTLTPGARYIYPGYDQYEVCSTLASVLNRASSIRGRRGVLLIRPHPREDDPPRIKSTDTVKVIYDNSSDVHHAMLSADLVTGMTSIALVEACYMGCLTLSLQPGALYPEAVACNIAGVSASVRTWAEFDALTERMLFDPHTRAEYSERLKSYAVDGRAVDRVVELIVQRATMEKR